MPAAGRHAHDAVADAVIDVEPEGIFEVPVDAFFGEPLAGSSSVCTDQHPMRHLGRVVADLVTGTPRCWELSERISEDRNVIDRGVRSGVARAKFAGEDFVGLSADGEQWVMPVAAFVVRAGVLLVGFGVDQRRVEVDD